MSLAAPSTGRARGMARARSEPPEAPPSNRAIERRLLLWTVPVALFAAFAVTRSPGAIQPELPEAVWAFGLVVGACLLLHVAFSLARFDGDPFILPALSLLFVIGTAYHIGLPRAGGGTWLESYLTGVVVATATLAAVVFFSGGLRRLGWLFEEKVWWRWARDLPYYESAPFHLLLVGLMVLLVGWLLIGGRPSGSSGAIVLVPLFGRFSFTPSEFIRLAVAFFLADYLGRHSRVLRNLRQPVVNFSPLNRLTVENRAQLVVLLVTVLLYCLFFVVFRDFGPAAVIFALTLLCLTAATLRPFTPLLLLAIGLGVIWLTSVGPGGAATGTLHNRMAMWWNPWDTRFMNGDHQARILWAIASGGWFGLGSGVVNLRTYLPEAARDTALAGIAASMGLWVALSVLALLAAIACRGYRIARGAATDRARLLAFSLTSLLALQAIWICGAMVRLFPFSGINLPFISTGLSSVIASSIALGALLNLSRSRAAEDATEATPEVRRGVRLLSWPVLLAFALPAVGLLLYGAPPLLGDRTLVRKAVSPGRDGQRVAFPNPYLEAFRSQFPRGRVYSADGALLAVSDPGAADRALISQRSPSFSMPRRVRKGDRFYPMGSLTAHLVGWTTRGRFASQEGSVETEHDSLLRGYRDADLPRLFRMRHNPLIRRPRPSDLHLTVDLRVQRAAARRLREAVRASSGAGGAIVLMDAGSGQVLAAVTEPTLDPNGLTAARMQQYIASHSRTQVLTNKALGRGAVYFPGSTFKLVTAAAALQHPVTGEVNCAGHNTRPLSWTAGGTKYRRPEGRIDDFGSARHGELGLRDSLPHALTVSCNVFFATLAARLGVDPLRSAIEQAELSHPPTADDLGAYLPEAGFGQVVVKVAPVEMAMLAAAIGVSGTTAGENAGAARPYWVERVDDGRGRYRPTGMTGTVSDQLFRPFPTAVARELREMMLEVVNDGDGTAYAAFHRGGAPRLPGVTVGGKTGTAEFDREVTVNGRKVRSRRTHAWFVGFARNEREVQPRTLAFAVLVEDVRGKRSTGGSVCAPAARDVLADLFGPFPEPEPAPAVPDERSRRPWWELLNPRRWLRF